MKKINGTVDYAPKESSGSGQIIQTENAQESASIMAPNSSEIKGDVSVSVFNANIGEPKPPIKQNVGQNPKPDLSQYIQIGGCEYLKDGKTYYFNTRTQKMETKDERIDSCLDNIEVYLIDLNTKLPNNAYAKTLLSKVQDDKESLKQNLCVIDSKAGINTLGATGFGGFGKLYVNDEVFNSDVMFASQTILHELVHNMDNDSATSKTEELDAGALSNGLLAFYKSFPLKPKSQVKIINENYPVVMKESDKHKLDDPDLDELRNHLGCTEEIQALLNDDNAATTFTGNFINTAGNVLHTGIAAGEAVSSKENQAVGRAVGGAIATPSAIFVGFVYSSYQAIKKSINDFFAK